MLEDDLARLRQVVARGGTAPEVDAALEPVAAARDPRSIGPLLVMLNDDADDDGMWSIIHAAEQFDDATYVDEFLRSLSDLVVASSRWASIVMTRAINSDATRAALVRQLRTAPHAIRRAAATLCHGINERDVRFLAKTTLVLVAAGE